VNKLQANTASVSFYFGIGTLNLWQWGSHQ